MTESSSANKRIAKNTIFLSIRMVIVLFINLFTTRIVLQALGIVDYGVYNVVCGFVSMFSFINTSMSNGIQRFFNFEYGKNKELGAQGVFCTSLYIQSSLAIIAVVLIELVGLWYLNNKMVIPFERMTAARWIFQFSILTFLSGVMQAPFSAAVIAHEKMDFYAILSVADVLLKLGIAYIIKRTFGDQLIVYGVLIFAISVFNLIVYILYCKKNFKEIQFGKGFDKELFMKMFSFSGWNLFGTFSNMIENQGINLVLNFFFGPIVNAARGVATQINGGLQSFVANITTPVRPQVIQSYATGKMDRMVNLTFGVSKICGLIILMLAIPISLEIDFILHIWLGNDIPEHTGTFAILIVFASFFNTLQSSLSTVVHATGKMKRYQLSCSIIRVSSVLFAFIAVSFYRIPEIPLLIVLMLTVIVLFVSVLIVHQLIGLSIKHYFRKIILPLMIVFILSTIALFPMHLYLSEGLLRVIIVFASSTILISVLSLFLVFSSEERTMIKSFSNSVINKFKMK